MEDRRLTCTVPECFHLAVRNGLCWTHTWRKAHGRCMSAPIPETLSPFARYVEACIAVADCDSEDDRAFARAVQMARRAGEIWLESIGWTRPAENGADRRAG